MDASQVEFSSQIIFSESVSQQPIIGGVRTDVINPFIQLTVPFVKTTQNVTVTIILFGLDLSNKHTFEFKITDKEDKELFTTKSQDLPTFSEVSSLNLNLEIKNIIVSYEGKYSGVLFIDNEKKETRDFYVVVNEPK